MKVFMVVMLFGSAMAEIRQSLLVNKLSKVKPVGGPLDKKFLSLTEIPPPHIPHTAGSGRRHMENPDCNKKPEGQIVYEGGNVIIGGEDYDDNIAKTVATVIFPDHIDRKFFEVTTQVPYLTVGPIEAIGFHPVTQKSDHPPECEKIYQDFLDDQYSDEDTDYSEESLEMARMPLYPVNRPTFSAEARIEKMYDDIGWDM